ncbi:MAG: NAD(P)-dependent oxidoreductase [Candidatus Omnitrophica bacterium]|nr:NAD(P)-dependent oxidoreductase [Candidatus Omnitrophota bacterium]
MNILVTGGAGYIGSILVPTLLAEGHKVTVIDNFMYNQTPLLDCCWNPGLTIIRGDVRDTKLLAEQMKKADVILPLACLTGAPLCVREPHNARAINYDAVKTISDMKSASQLMIFPSTNSGYGIGQEGIHCDEDTPLCPVSMYGKLKVDIEKYILDKGAAVTFRFATVFGISPRMRLDLLVNDFTYRAVVDRAMVIFEPHFKRNYLHVRDAARVFIHAIRNYDKMKGKPYNVGLSDANLNKEELCKVIQKHIPQFTFVVSPIGEDPDKRNYVVSNKKIEATGYKTTVSLDEGIKELIKGYQVIRRNQFANV